MQVKATPNAARMMPFIKEANAMIQKDSCAPERMESHLEDARTCLPGSLLEMHVKATRRHAALLASGVALPSAVRKKQKQRAG